MNNELIEILLCFKKVKLSTSITLCDVVLNSEVTDVPKCDEVDCGNCAVSRTQVHPGKYYSTQIRLTMEAVNHETRNPTSD